MKTLLQKNIFRESSYLLHSAVRNLCSWMYLKSADPFPKDLFPDPFLLRHKPLRSDNVLMSQLSSPLVNQYLKYLNHPFGLTLFNSQSSLYLSLTTTVVFFRSIMSHSTWENSAPSATKAVWVRGVDCHDKWHK